MKITVKNLKPRNPLVALARSRRAGSHRASVGAMRQRSGRDLKHELDQMNRHSP